MTTFDKREEAYENKFSHEKELEFKIRARRNKLLGHWVAEKLGLRGENIEEYVKAIVDTGVHNSDDDTIKDKILNDFISNNVKINKNEIQKEINRLHDLASDQLKNIK